MFNQVVKRSAELCSRVLISPTVAPPALRESRTKAEQFPICRTPASTWEPGQLQYFFLSMTTLPEKQEKEQTRKRKGVQHMTRLESEPKR